MSISLAAGSPATSIKNTGAISAGVNTEAVVARGVIRSFDDIITSPKSLWGKSADEVGDMLGEGWTKGAYGSKGTGWKFTKGDQSVFYHPGGWKTWRILIMVFLVEN